MHPKYLFFSNIPTPHKVYLFNILNNLLEGKIHFVFLSGTSEKRKKWHNSLKEARFRYTVLDSFTIKIAGSDEAYWFIPKKLPDLKRYRKVIISGGLTPVEMFLALMCVANRIPYVVWSEATSLFGGNILIRLMRILVRFIIFSNAEMVICGSSMAENHARSLGAKRTRVVYTTTDIERFMHNKKHSGRCINLVYIGRIIERKRVRDVVMGVKGLKWVNLHIIGEGEDEERVKRLSKMLGVNTRFIGWISYDKLPEKIRKYDVMILPSINEVFGYVVVESIAAGIIPVVSDQVGSKDLVEKSLIFKVKDSKSIARIIDRLRDPRLRNTLMEVMKANLLKYGTPEIWAKNFAEVIVS